MNYVERLAVIKRDMNAILDVAETEKRGLTPEERAGRYQSTHGKTRSWYCCSSKCNRT
jgi:hypothetical protein